jgi:hypothetical protein
MGDKLMATEVRFSTASHGGRSNKDVHFLNKERARCVEEDNQRIWRNAEIL